jgi:hypothetical protein
LIVDAQSVKNTDSARHKGYNASKKVSGINRRIAVVSAENGTKELALFLVL